MLRFSLLVCVVMIVVSVGLAVAGPAAAGLLFTFCVYGLVRCASAARYANIFIDPLTTTATLQIMYFDCMHVVS